MTDPANKARLILGLRQAGITDTGVLSAIELVPRELFVPDNLADHAYDDNALPIACGQTISQPTVVAWMTAALEIGDRMRVLEIGTGSGYQAAILAHLCRRVYTVERHRDLAKVAQKRFQNLNLNNISSRIGDGSLGWPEQAPFERIVVTAAALTPPPALLDQLALGGIMVLPLGEPNGDQTLVRLRRDEDGFHRERIFDVRFVPLIEGFAGEPAR
ncbi:MAG: protein-L-isoaspartate(D-aspartate) O-methyltransferase [Alphaproteobacteria bacterium]